MKKLLDALFARVAMDKAGEPADTGSAGTEPTDTEPAKQEPDTPTQEPAEPSKQTEPAAKKSLLGGADETGSAEPKPDGGVDDGDGNKEPQDPYESLQLPAGANAEEVASYKKLAGELNLKAEDAQRILDFESKRLQDAAAQAAASWEKETKQKYGEELPTVLATAARAVQQFGGNELRELLDQTGLGNHPILVEAFNKAGALLKEDKMVPSNGAASGDVTFTQALYGNHRSK